MKTYSVYLLVALVLNPIPSSSFLFSHGSGVFRPVTIKGYPGLVLLGVFVGLRTSGWAKGSFFCWEGGRGSIHSRNFLAAVHGPVLSCVTPLIVYCPI